MKLIKPMAPIMQIAWHSASLTLAIGATIFMYSAGYSIADASLAQLTVVVFGFSLGSFLLRLFFQQADTPGELFRNFLFSRKSSK